MSMGLIVGLDDDDDAVTHRHEMVELDCIIRMLI